MIDLSNCVILSRCNTSVTFEMPDGRVATAISPKVLYLAE